ncbi:MAG TPA: hypothetical protein VIH61_08035 [Waddliaceae bacterium]
MVTETLQKRFWHMRKGNIFLGLFCVAFAVILTGCGAKSRSSKVDPIESRVRRTVELSHAGQSCWPLSLDYRKLSLAEIAYYLEMDEKNVSEHLKAMNTHGYYGLIAKNFPPGREFVLYHMDYTGNVHASKTFFVSADGNLVTPMDETTVELSNNFLVFANYIPGEPVDFVLVSKDGEFSIALCIVPNPIEAVNNQGQKVSVQIASPDRKLYRVHCEGLEPFGIYMLTSSFENENLAFTLEANENGKLSQLIGPTIPWIKSGEAYVELRGERIARPIYLKFIWGLREEQ